MSGLRKQQVTGPGGAAAALDTFSTGAPNASGLGGGQTGFAWRHRRAATRAAVNGVSGQPGYSWAMFRVIRISSCPINTSIDGLTRPFQGQLERPGNW